MRPRIPSRTRVEPDGSIASIQTLLIPGARLPGGPVLEALLLALVPRYTAWIAKLTADFVEIVHEPGGFTRARVRPFGPTGLVLGPPRIEGSALVRDIVEGVLVERRSGTIAVRLEETARGVLASVDIEGFYPRVHWVPVLGPTLFFMTQDVIHARHSRGFLRYEVAPRLIAANANVPRHELAAAAV